MGYDLHISRTHEWIDAEEVVSLHWWCGQITVTGVLKTEAVSSMRWIADEFEAFMVSDDDEIY